MFTIIIYFTPEVFWTLFKKDFYQISSCSILKDTNIKNLRNIIHNFEALNSSFVFLNFISKKKTEIINILDPLTKKNCQNEITKDYVLFSYKLYKEINYSQELYNFEYSILSKIKLAITKIDELKKVIPLGIETEKKYYSDLKKICTLKEQQDLLTKHINIGSICRKSGNSKKHGACQTLNISNRISKDKENFQNNYSLFKQKWLHLKTNENSDEYCQYL